MAGQKKIAVIGGGSWATAIVKMLCNNVKTVNWWMRNKAAAAHLLKYQHNPNYLSSVEFNREKINVSTDLREIIAQSDVLIMATPSAFLHDLFKNQPKDGIKDKIVFSAIKGIVPEQHEIPATYFHNQFDVPYENIGIISGPCHAEEVAMERLSYLTISCQTEPTAQMLADLLSCRYIKATVTEDIFGTEYSAVLKNIFAIASGICNGLGYGDNFQAVLIANAIQEINRFVDAVSPVHRDVKSSAYLGDLLVTAYSQFSRNRTFGTMIGKGYSVKAAQLEMAMVAEGYYAVGSIKEINKELEVDMPIAEAVYNVLYERISPVVEMRILTEKLT
jgi:glycerol-3-phosphate dehydrogenase (NAD(P)+)